MSRSVAPSSLSRRLTRRATIAVLAGTGVAALLAGAGCSAGQIAETARERSAVPGVNADAGPIALRNLTVQYPDNHVYAAGDSAPLVVRIVNTGGTADTLQSVTTDAGQVTMVQGGAATTTPTGSPTGSPTATPTGTASPTGSPTATPTGSATGSPTGSPTAGAPAGGSTSISVPLPARQSVQLVPTQDLGEGVLASGQYLVVNGLKKPLRPGESLTVVFTFANAGSVTVNVPVGVPAQVTERPSASDAKPTDEG